MLFKNNLYLHLLIYYYIIRMRQYLLYCELLYLINYIFIMQIDKSILFITKIPIFSGEPLAS